MKPILQALVLAERIYEDKSGKKIIAGTFNQVFLGTIPTPEVKLPNGTSAKTIATGNDPGCPAAYISVTDVHDETEIVLQFTNLSTNETLFQTGIKINTTDRLTTVEIAVPLPAMNFLFRSPGTYSFDVIWKGEILGSHRLLVKQLGAPGGA